jgi:hypothetical protein
MLHHLAREKSGLKASGGSGPLQYDFGIFLA